MAEHEGNAPIDETYYHLDGPAEEWEEHFDPHICSYDDLWNHFAQTIHQSNSAHDPQGQCVDWIGDAISKASEEHQVEEYIILCIIMQESTGNCYVPTTYDANGQPNGGLMQCEGSKGWDGKSAMDQTQIETMIDVGTAHFAQCLAQQHENVYEALRIYNSGSIAPSGDLSDPHSVGTPSYVNDVANRTHGWISGGNT